MEAAPALRLHPGRCLATAALAALAALSTGGCSPPEEPVAPFEGNVVVVLIDALRADRVGAYGYPLPTTPHIDALAAEGVVFDAALSHSTWTKPAIATLFTSLYPSQHGIQRASLEAGQELRTEVLDERLTTLAERLSAAGLATGAMIDQVHLQARFGFNQGFGTYIDKRGRGAFKLNSWFEGWAKRLQGRRFFAYLHYLDLHWPFNKQIKGMADAFGPTEMKSVPPQSGQRAPEWGMRLNDPDDLRALQARYDHEVAYTDAALGDLVARLRALGVFDDTLLIVTSDHGEAFLEHGMLGHGFAPHEELIRIPLVVRPPRPLGGFTGRVERPVGLIDLMPTLLDLIGLEPEPQAQGESFAPLLRGRQMADRVQFFETFDAFAARSRTHKLIWLNDDRQEFYDLVADPGESRSLAEPCEGPCRHLARLLRPFRSLMLESRESNRAGTAELRQEDIETLRALGYLE